MTATPLAHAQVGAEEPGSTPKGTIGGGLLGAELVMSVEAIFDVKPWWAYALGGGLGAVGGALGGFAVDQADVPEASAGLLVGGIVFAVPATIAVLSATSYTARSNPTIEPTEDSGNPDEALLRLEQPQVRPLPPTVVGYDSQGWRWGVPAVRVGQVYSLEDRVTYALPSETEVLFPLVGVSF